MPFDTALAAILGYARGRRPVRFRSPDSPQGRWVQLPAFGWARFDARPIGPAGDTDVLISEGLHGRLDDEWQAHCNGGYDEPGRLASAQRAERGRGGFVERRDR